MLNMNRATLLGHAGRDPEIRDLKNGEKAAVFTLATTEKWKRQDGEMRPKPRNGTGSWSTGPAVEAVGTMVRKGRAVLVEGRIASRSYTDSEGKDRQITEIVVAGRQGVVNVLSGRSAAAAQRTDREGPEGGADAGGAAAQK